jgi:hypothetical protein
MNNYDFSGYATRNDLLCEDGRTIRKDAFKDNDGATVPLIWNHNHKDSQAVLGHALLENRKDGVYAYCTFNDTEEGKHAKQLVHNGDVRSLSIYANKLKQVGGDVIHGSIKELSLVLAGSNPGAYIDFVMAHGEDEDDGLWANYDENALVIYHSSEKESGENKMNKEELDQQKENGDDNEKKEKKRKKEKNIQEVFNELTEEQQEVVYALIGMALEDANKNENDDDDKKGDGNMKHNVFDNDERKQDYLSHSAQEDIIKLAKSSQVGSLQTALEIYADSNDLQHDAISGGFTQDGTGNVTMLYPEYQDVRPGAPELITNDQGWISAVMNKVHKSPISRIRTRYVDIRKINDLRAKGYKKGKEKTLAGNFNLVKRTTDPQTVYVRNALHRDDIIDITDFDYVNYLYNVDKIMLDEELATAILLGDGRDIGADDKIMPDKIRPIWTDDDLYTIHVDLDIDKAKKELQGTGTGVSFGENYIYAEALIDTVLHARENYKGSGTPDFFVTPHMLNVMLLARDMNGRRIYSSKAELATTLNVGNIYTAEQFKDKTRTTEDSKKKKILGIVVNLADYSLGATKGGEVTHFTQFDIDFNQEKSLIETRCSGALTRIYSAIAIEEDVTADSRNIVG